MLFFRTHQDDSARHTPGMFPHSSHEQDEYSMPPTCAAAVHIGANLGREDLKVRDLLGQALEGRSATSNGQISSKNSQPYTYIGRLTRDAATTPRLTTNTIPNVPRVQLNSPTTCFSATSILTVS